MQAGPAVILHGIDLTVAPGEILGVVGESGSGKSTLAAAVLGMLPPGLHATGSIRLQGAELLGLPQPALARLRGERVAAVFQDPMGALNPLFTVATHLDDVLRRRHPALPRAARRRRAAAALAHVGLADPASRLRAYPHELSGGMRQRVAIAMALLAEPALLIADEATTALDATVEAQVAELFAGLRPATGTLFISHHLGLVAQLCDTVCVLYGGRVMELGAADTVLRTPLHPYTQALLACEVEAEGTGPLAAIPGDVPSPAAPPPGCIFAPRCPRAEPACRQSIPPLSRKTPGQRAACLLVPDA